MVATRACQPLFEVGGLLRSPGLANLRGLGWAELQRAFQPVLLMSMSRSSGFPTRDRNYRFPTLGEKDLPRGWFGLRVSASGPAASGGGSCVQAWSASLSSETFSFTEEGFEA